MKKFLTLLACIALFKVSYSQSVGGTVSPNAVVCSGTNSGVLTLSGHTGAVVRWQSSINNGGAWTNIANTTTTLAYSNLTATTWYRCEVLSTPPAAFSTPAVITVDAASAGTVTSNASVCSGINSGTLTVAGTFTSVSDWEFSVNGGTSWTPLTNATGTQNEVV